MIYEAFFMGVAFGIVAGVVVSALCRGDHA